MPSTAPSRPHSPRPPRDAQASRPWNSHAGPSLTKAQEWAHLARVLASSPTYLAWLHEHNARLLETEAARLAERGQPLGAVLLRESAQAHRRQEVTPW